MDFFLQLHRQFFSEKEANVVRKKGPITLLTPFLIEYLYAQQFFGETLNFLAFHLDRDISVRGWRKSHIYLVVMLNPAASQIFQSIFFLHNQNNCVVILNQIHIMRLHLEHCIQFWHPQHKEKSSKPVGAGLEEVYENGQCWKPSMKRLLRESELFSLEKEILHGDLIMIFPSLNRT